MVAESVDITIGSQGLSELKCSSFRSLYISRDPFYAAFQWFWNCCVASEIVRTEWLNAKQSPTWQRLEMLKHQQQCHSLIDEGCYLMMWSVTHTHVSIPILTHSNSAIVSSIYMASPCHLSRPSSGWRSSPGGPGHCRCPPGSDTGRGWGTWWWWGGGFFVVFLLTFTLCWPSQQQPLWPSPGCQEHCVCGS